MTKFAKKKSVPQVEYLGRWVPRDHFRVWVYGFDNAKKLAESYAEYKALIAEGKWFDRKEDVPFAKAKKVIKDGADS